MKADTEQTLTRAQRSELEYRQGINRAVQYLQGHAGEPVSLEKLSEAAGFSPFHFHRIFCAFMGETVGESNRRLRLQQAAGLLAGTRQPVTTIALSTGFATASAFSRAFRKYFLCSPTEVRRSGSIPAAVPPAAGLIRDKGRNTMNAEIRILPDRDVFYVTRSGLINNNFNHAADLSFDVLCRFVSAHHLWKRIETCLGICPDENTGSENSRYMGGFIFLKGTKVDSEGEVQKMTIPGGRFAVFIHKGPYETLWQSWNAAYRDGLPALQLKERDAPPYEVYLKDKHTTPPEELLTEIHIPVE